MGQVYKAEHKRMERVVALKTLPSAATKSPEAVQMPPMAQMRRLHRTPKLLTAHSMPVPIVMEQVGVNGSSFTWSVMRSNPALLMQGTAWN